LLDDGEDLSVEVALVAWEFVAARELLTEGNLAFFEKSIDIEEDHAAEGGLVVGATLADVDDLVVPVDDPVVFLGDLVIVNNLVGVVNDLATIV
jgi:hypothetical protein